MTAKLYTLASILVLMMLAAILALTILISSLKRKPSIDKIAAFDLAFLGGAM